MKYLFLAAALLFTNAYASENNTIKLTVLNSAPIIVGKPVTVHMRLTTIEGDKPVSIHQLKKIHTKRFHALVVESTLTDYHHEHPVAGSKPGEYSFTFTPNKPGDYRIWADITPVSTGKQEYAVADLKATTSSTGVIDKTINSYATVGHFRFTLSLDGPLKAGQATMGKVTVTKDGEPFAQLQPVMGAYAHIVGFYDDWKKVVHIHPMGKEPTQPEQRGGPELQFHMEPSQAGFIKLFVQTKIGDQTIFAPFGVMVSP